MSVDPNEVWVIVEGWMFDSRELSPVAVDERAVFGLRAGPPGRSDERMVGIDLDVHPVVSEVISHPGGGSLALLDVGVPALIGQSLCGSCEAFTEGAAMSGRWQPYLDSDSYWMPYSDYPPKVQAWPLLREWTVREIVAVTAERQRHLDHVDPATDVDIDHSRTTFVLRCVDEGQATTPASWLPNPSRRASLRPGL